MDNKRTEEMYSDDPTIKANYKRYKNILRLCLKQAYLHTIMTYLLKQKTQSMETSGVDNQSRKKKEREHYK